MKNRGLMKAGILVLLLTAIALPQLVACHKEAISWRDIEKNPEKYSGRTVALCGWLRMGFEVCGFSEKASNNYGGPGAIWVSPAEEGCAEADNSRNRQGWYVVTGTYAHNAKYPAEGFGHLGAYEAEISEATIVPLEKGCGEQVRN